MSPIKILPVEKIRELDNYTIKHEPIRSVDLMERAAEACFDWITKKVESPGNYTVFCGMGNNGGDGLALARMLHLEGNNVEVYYIHHSDSASNDNQLNFKRASDIPGLVINELFSDDTNIVIEDHDIVIDALLGSGLNKQTGGALADVIDQINNSNGYVISIDMPSGLYADNPVDSRNPHIIEADYTLTFQMPKLGFFVPENDKYVGKWIVLDIGLSDEFIEEYPADFHLTEKKDISQILKPRKRFSHKGMFGHGLIIGGSLGKVGAAILASKAAMRSGAGLITTHVPYIGMTSIHTAIPEVMLSLDSSETHIAELPDTEHYNAIAIGPGIGIHEETGKVLKLLIQESKKQLIIDADGLNILSENKTWLSFLPQNTILTPHPKEFERLTSKVSNHFNRLEILSAFSARYKVFTILKGAYSAVGCPDGAIYFNPTGNPGMATAGSGDVLTGILLGLAASGYSPFETCILGTWLHGKSADIAVKHLGQPSLIASDIIDFLGLAFKKVSN